MLRGFFHPSFLTPLSLMLLFIPTVFAAPIQSLLQTSLGEPLLDDTLALFPLKLEFSRGRSSSLALSYQPNKDATRYPKEGFPSRELFFFIPNPVPVLVALIVPVLSTEKKGKEEKGRGGEREETRVKKKEEFSRLVSFLHALYFFFLFEKFLLEKTRGSVVSLLSTREAVVEGIGAVVREIARSLVNSFWGIGSFYGQLQVLDN